MLSSVYYLTRSALLHVLFGVVISSVSKALFGSPSSLSEDPASAPALGGGPGGGVPLGRPPKPPVQQGSREPATGIASEPRWSLSFPRAPSFWTLGAAGLKRRPRDGQDDGLRQTPSECGAPAVLGAVARVPGTARGSRKAAWVSCPPQHDPEGPRRCGAWLRGPLPRGQVP